MKLGRTTFANTIKYIFITSSANFSNMFSMASASLFLPFLPLLPKQVLLINLMSDFPAMTIATDRVDKALIDKPKRWDMKFIASFMVVFGLVSSVVDFLVFGIVYFALKSSESTFQTSWFIFSIISELLILFVIRTRKFSLKSKPGKLLLIVSILTTVITIAMPYIPEVNEFLGFEPLKGLFLGVIFGLIVFYVLITEITKKIFYRYIPY